MRKAGVACGECQHDRPRRSPSAEGFGEAVRNVKAGVEIFSGARQRRDGLRTLGTNLVADGAPVVAGMSLAMSGSSQTAFRVRMRWNDAVSTSLLCFLSENLSCSGTRLPG